MFEYQKGNKNVYCLYNIGDNVNTENEITKELEQQIREKLDKEGQVSSAQMPVFEFKNAGDTLIGKVLAIREVNTRVGKRKLLEIRTKDGDFAVWLSHKVLEEELNRKEVNAGDYIGIRFHGKPQGKNYYVYTVVKL